MNAIDIGFALYVALISIVALLRLYSIRKTQKNVASYGSQRMCRACGSITPRVEAYCRQCGKPFPVK
jgi:predicted amidophosphoribosyltransferase